MTIKELVNELHLTETPEELDPGTYTIDLGSSDNFNNLYSTLSTSKSFDQDVDEFELDGYKTTLVFFNDYYNLELIGDFDENKYTLNIYEVR